MSVVKILRNKNIQCIFSRVLNRKINFSTHQGILTSGIPDIEIPKVPINEFVLEKISNWENYTAIECAATGRKYTYNQIRKKSKNFCGVLRKKFKLEKGDVIGILLPNIPEYAIVALGALQAGLICTMVNPIYTPTEISKQLSDSSARLFVTLNELWPLAIASTNLTKKNIPVIAINTKQGQALPRGCVNFTELDDTDIDYTEINDIKPDDVALLPYSSGTTGFPKGVQLTHLNIVANLCQLEHPQIGVSQKSTASHQDVIPAVLPFFHIYGLIVLCMYHLRLGSKIVTLPKFTPELYVGTLRKQRPHVLYIAPPLAIFLANHPSVKKEDFASVRAIANGSSHLGVLDEAKLLKKAGKELSVVQGYGLTETSPAILTTRVPDLNKKHTIGSLGLPIPNTEVKIIGTDDTTGSPLGPNQIGELLVRGPQVMKGYLNRPEENIFFDGWMRTGDIMYYNDEGYLFIKDRLKELIKVKGFQVPPAELEEIIRDHPDIVDAGVIGIPHPTHGEVPKAFVVPKDDAKIDTEQLKEYVNSKVASYKYLRGGITVLGDLPKNAAGKILRRELKKLHEEEAK